MLISFIVLLIRVLNKKYKTLLKFILYIAIVSQIWPIQNLFACLEGHINHPGYLSIFTSVMSILGDTLFYISC